MSSDRYVVLGLAHVRSDWFREVSRWSTSGVAPIEFVKCVSVDEVRARVASGRAFSALLVDADLPGVDRDLIEAARGVGCAVLAVADAHARRDLVALGAAATLPEFFDSALLVTVLSEHSALIGSAAARTGPPDGERPPPQAWRGAVVAVTGAGGSGTSTVAMGLAQGLAADVRARGRVLLADFALDADQAMLHDARDVVPGVQELVEAFRHGTPGADELANLTFGDGHPYRLLLGLRRHQDWTSLRPRAFQAALECVRRHHTQVVCDIDPDLEGERDSGSFDIEERNLMARTAVDAAALVVVVTGTPGLHGTHRLVQLLARLVDHGVPVERILPVVNRAPRAARARAELSRTIVDLVTPLVGTAVSTFSSPLFLPEQRRLEQSVRDGVGVPTTMAASLAAAAFAMLERGAGAPVVDLTAETPTLITPGSLGSWAAEQGAAG